MVNKYLFSLFACFAILSMPLIGEEEITESEVVQVDVKKLSETFGNFIGKSINSPALSFDIDSLIAGIRSGAEGKAAPLTEEEYEEGMAYLQEEMFSTLSKDNLDGAEKYLVKNVEQEAIVSLEENKLQYKVLSEGNGEVVLGEMSPEIHYTGRLLDGEVFGSSEESGPIVLNLAHTIPGFRKGIEGMKEGEKRTLYIHPDLGYGVTGQLPPNSLLIFDVEVVRADAPKEDPFASLGDTEFDSMDFDEDLSLDDQMTN